MKKSEIKTAKTQDLILSLCRFYAGITICKGEQKEALWVIEELVNRGVIEDDLDFIGKSRGFYLWDCMPEKYKKECM